MKNTILETYAMTFCLFCVTCFAITSGIALYDVVQITDPQFTLNRIEFDRFQSNEAYQIVPPFSITEKAPKESKVLTEEQVTKSRIAEHDRVIRSERRAGKQSLLHMLIIMLIDTVLFAIHWKVGRAARSSTA